MNISLEEYELLQNCKMQIESLKKKKNTFHSLKKLMRKKKNKN